MIDTANPNNLYVAAATYRVSSPKPEDGATITIPVAIFDQLLSVVSLASKADSPHLRAAALLVITDGERHTATFSHPLIGACTATASSRLQAIAAAEREVEATIA